MAGSNKSDIAKDVVTDSSGLAGQAARAKIKRRMTMADRMKAAGLNVSTGGVAKRNKGIMPKS